MGLALAIAGIAASLIGTAVTVYAQYSQAEEQKKAANAEASLRTQEGESARQSAAFQERQYRTRVSMLLGEQVAIGAASGVDVSSGSPLLMQLSNVRQAEMEALNIRRTGAVSAAGSDFEAKLAKMRAGFLGQSATGALFAGGVRAGGTILSGWSTYYNRGKGGGGGGDISSDYGLTGGRN